jgi:hypothetical protein
MMEIKRREFCAVFMQLQPGRSASRRLLVRAFSWTTEQSAHERRKRRLWDVLRCVGCIVKVSDSRSMRRE